MVHLADTAWCQNPESHSKKPEIAFYAERCRRCFLCAKACPEGAILDGSERRVDRARCTACGACAAACPADALRLIGKEWDVEAFTAELARDRDYFQDSGGGVTLSGGEPMAQPAFALELARVLHHARIHVNLETCGAFAWLWMEKLLPFVNLIYFDLKIMDPQRHMEWTGAANTAITANFTRLSRRFKNLQARMPVIPGVNDDAESIHALAGFLRKAGRKSIHCLPYHGLGEAKIPRIDSAQKPMNVPADAAAASIASVKALFRREGINAVVYE